MKRNQKRLHVLVVEDNPINQKRAARLLSQQGHSVVVRTNGRDALTALGLEGEHAAQDVQPKARNSEREEEREPAAPFDLVLMDVKLPDMDGYAATGIIRDAERDTGRRLPIIGLAMRAIKTDRDRCLRAGMDACLTRPIQPAQLARVLAKFAPPADPQTTAPEEVLDHQAILDRVNHDVDVLREIIRLFRDDCPRLMVELRQAVASQDAPRVQQTAQALAGSVGTMSAQAIVDAARKLEALGQAGNLQSAAVAYASLEQGLLKLRAALEGLVPAVAFS